MKVKSILTAAGCAGLAALLSACGGGGSGTISGTGEVSNSVSPGGTVAIVAGNRVNVASSAKVYFGSVTSHKWSVTQVSGPAAPEAPTVADANCAGATIAPGNPSEGSNPGRNGTSNCSTSVVVPMDTPTSEWVVENVARSATGSAAGKFTLKVTANTLADSGFNLNITSLPQMFQTDKTASLNAAYVINEGAQLDKPVSYEWSQVSGTPVPLAGSQTATVSFIPRQAGDYVFKVKATAVIAGKSVVREGAIVAVAEVPQAARSYNVSAGNLQAAEINATVTLAGAVSGDVPAAELSYKWTQVSGPVVALFGDTSLAPQFTGRTNGDYVFELAVTRSGTTPVVKTSRTMVSVYTPQTAQPFFTVSAGDAQVAAPNATVALRAQVVAGTPAPTNLTYSWVQKSGPTVAISSANSQNASFVPTQAGTYEFTFKAVSGAQEKTDTAVVVVTAPTSGYFSVNAGPLQASPVSVAVTLNGSVGGSVPAQELVYNWVQVGGPGVTLFRANSLTPEFLPTAAGEYSFELRVNRANDATNVQTSRTMVAVYSPYGSPSEPFFAVSAGDVQIVGPSPLTVKLNGTIVTGTPAPSNVVYKWTQLTGAPASLANDATLQASFIAPAVGLYTFELSATAGGVTKKAVTAVQVLAVAPTPAGS